MIYHVYTSLGTCACMVYLFEEHYPQPSYKLAASYMYVTLQENGSEAADPTSPPDISSEEMYQSSSASVLSGVSSIDLDSFLGPEHPVPAGSLTTFKIVGDNIDKNVKKIGTQKCLLGVCLYIIKYLHDCEITCIANALYTKRA